MLRLPPAEMFKGQKTNLAQQTKGLQSVPIDRAMMPAHLGKEELKPAAAAFRPESKIPTRGTTELTREDRHSAHLRKKRIQKIERRRKEGLLRNMAKTNKKLQTKLEKQDALKTLGKHKNVKIIKKK